jgi:hypothetical protein
VEVGNVGGGFFRRSIHSQLQIIMHMLSCYGTYIYLGKSTKSPLNPLCYQRYTTHLLEDAQPIPDDSIANNLRELSAALLHRALTGPRRHLILNQISGIWLNYYKYHPGSPQFTRIRIRIRT